MTLPATLRAATMNDVEAVAEVWHRGWIDGHRGQVPEALLPHRTLEHSAGGCRRASPPRPWPPSAPAWWAS